MRFRHLFFILIYTLSISCSSNDDNTNDETTQEETTQEEITAKLTGNFVDAAHPTSGIAMVNEEMTQLMLTNFKSDDGPNLELYIATDTEATNYITLGSLKGLEGDFVYELPENVDFQDYNHVMVWCVPFEVNFGHAVLE